MPMRRFAGTPLSRYASVVMTSSGLVTHTNTASGEASRAAPITDRMMPAFTPSRSSRVMPGLRAMPAVMTAHPAMLSHAAVGIVTVPATA